MRSSHLSQRAIGRRLANQELPSIRRRQLAAEPLCYGAFRFSCLVIRSQRTLDYNALICDDNAALAQPRRRERDRQRRQDARRTALTGDLGGAPAGEDRGDLLGEPRLPDERGQRVEAGQAWSPGSPASPSSRSRRTSCVTPTAPMPCAAGRIGRYSPPLRGAPPARLSKQM
jgi:hypothetical protein